MTDTDLTRRIFIGGPAGAAGLAAFGDGALAQLAMPKSPVALNIIDVAGNLALTQKDDRELPESEAERGLAHRLHQGPFPGAAWQAQGAAGCEPRRYRYGADRQ